MARAGGTRHLALFSHLGPAQGRGSRTGMAAELREGCGRRGGRGGHSPRNRGAGAARELSGRRARGGRAAALTPPPPAFPTEPRGKSPTGEPPPPPSWEPEAFKGCARVAGVLPLPGVGLIGKDRLLADGMNA